MHTLGKNQLKMWHKNTNINQRIVPIIPETVLVEYKMKNKIAAIVLTIQLVIPLFALALF